MIKQHRKVSKRVKKRTLTREQAKKVLERDLVLPGIHSKGMYPLDAPGMPLPGQNFLRHAIELGDTESSMEKVQVKDDTKKSGKRTEIQAKIGNDLKQLYLRGLREPGFTLPIEIRGGRTDNVTFVPGHIWGQHMATFQQSLLDIEVDAGLVDGPHPAEVMLIGKMPYLEETQSLRNMVGTSGEVLIEALKTLRIKGTPGWYITNLLKFQPPDGSSTIKAAWIKDCLPLLHQELRIVRPKYILCLGADATKALLGTKFNVSYMEGRVIDYTFPVGLDYEDTKKHTSLVMSVVHPASVVRDETQKRTLERGLARFNLLKQGIRFDKEEKGIDHRTIRTIEELEELCYEVENDPEKKDNVIAVDAEWHGEHPINNGAYLRTIQFAWKVKHACGIVLTGPGGVPTFIDSAGKQARKRGMALLRAYFKGGKYKATDGRTMEFGKKRVVGHFFNADLEWLVAANLDLRDEFAVPLYDLDLNDRSESVSLRLRYRKLGFKRKDTVPAWVRTRLEGGADTGMMCHAIEETASYKLETLSMRYTTVPRYDVPLHDWRDAYCKENNLKSSAIEGYGMCPDGVLVPYGIYDADATLRLFYEFDKMLDVDYEHNCCREAFWESMIAAPAVLEIHRTGILVDRDRIDFLTEQFLAGRSKLEKMVKKYSRWPDFNIRSVQHVKEFLFGEDLNGRVTKTGEVVRIRPQKGVRYKCTNGREGTPKMDAVSLYLDPLIDTGKPPRLWEDVVAKGREQDHNPSTNKMVLSIMAQENEEYSKEINWIRDYRFLDQVLKTLLRPPATDDEGSWLYDDMAPENLLYDAGLASVVCDDGRVRTHIYQTKETGRWSSARPNLQNISKQRDPDYKRLLGDGYKYKLRSVLQASPGHVLLEVDYTGAELYGMAIMSGDPAMIDHATRNQLPESNPDFYDIHSNVAVMAFNLKCAPTKTGLESLDKVHLRIIAKSVIFGIAYGRGAKAIALAAKEQGVNVSVNAAQRVIDTIFEMYPKLTPFFDECKSRATNERWLCHCFGRFRRFPSASDGGLAGEFERQAMNFPIQGTIASAMSRAIAYLYDARRQVGNPNLFKILLQIHDAILLEVPYEHVRFVAEVIIPWAMRTMVPIYPADLSGEPTGTGPYYLGAEAEVMSHWGELLTQEEAKMCNATQPVFSAEGMVVNYFRKA